MSKRTTTRGYIVAWVIYVLILVWVWFTVHNSASQGASSPPPPPFALSFYLMLAASGIAMLVFWIGALIRLGQIKAWGWFVAVLVLNLVGLGIAGMLAYAIAGPDDSMTVVTRPPTAT